MKSTLRILFALFALAVGTGARAQLTGTITVPSTTYPDLASVVTALNTQGVGTGGVIVNLTASTPQTAPAGGYQLGSTALNATTSATNTIVINGNGNTVTAPVGTSTTVDGIFFLKGVDYVTIDGLNLAESAANTTATTAMEYGYAIVNLNGAAPFDGAQNNTIKNCTITLNRTISTPSAGIYMAHTLSTSNAALTITATGDLHNNNKFYANTISNCIRGMMIIGFNAAAPYNLFDQGNDIGGTTAAQGNNITNFGTQYASIYGIYFYYQNNGNISNNIINNAANGGGVTNGALIGIVMGGTNSTFTVNRNNLTLTETPTASTYFLYGISCESGSSFTAIGNSITNVIPSGTTATTIQNGGILNGAGVDCNIANNTVNITHSISSTTAFVYSNATGNVRFYGNTLQSTNTTATTGAYYGFYAGGAAVSEAIDSNVVNGISLNTTGACYLIYASNATPNVSISKNRLTNFTRTSSGTTYSVYNLGAPTGGNAVLNGNVIANLTSTGTGSLYGIYYSTGSNQSVSITNDSVYNFSTGGGAAASYAIYNATGNTNTYINNYVANVVTGNGTVYGMYINGGLGGGAPQGYAYNNIITGLSSAGTSLYSMYIAAGNNFYVYGNKIYNNATSSASGNVYGIYVATCLQMNIYNNMISDLRTPASSGTSPVYGMYFSGGTNYNVYHNTINLTPVSTGTNFGSTGIYYGSGIGMLDLRNNIIRVMSTAAGTGTVVALRRSTGTAGTTPANFAQTSNGNIYYVTTAANHYFYNEGTSTTAVNGFNITNDPSFNSNCGLYKRFMAGRETYSFTENNLSQIGTTNTFAPTGASYAESAAVPTTSPAVTFDFNNVSRGTTPDIGALQFAGTAPVDIVPPAINYTFPTYVYCTSPVTLTATITDLSGVNTTSGLRPRLYFKKSTENNAFGGGNTSAVNGWKFVEGTNAGSQFSFVFNYALLNSPIAVGDSIYYFIIAQDNATTPNVGVNAIGFASGYCPASVDVLPAAGPSIAFPLVNAFKIAPQLPAPTVTPSAATICYGSSVVLSTPASTTLLSEDFEAGNTGLFTATLGATNTSTSPTAAWTNQTSPFTYGTVVFSSGAAGNKFVMSNSDVGGSLSNTNAILTTTGSINTSNYGSLTLSFKHFYQLNSTQEAKVQVSTNGTTWTDVQTYNVTTGSPGSFSVASINLNAYLNQAALKFRFLYNAAWGYYWAIDSVRLTGTIPGGPNWSPVTGLYKDAALTQALTATDTNSNVYASPATNTSYTVVTNALGCLSAPSASAAVTVNPAPLTAITYTGSASICQPATATLSAPAAPTGATYTYQWNRNGTPITGATSQTYAADTTGCYTVTVTNTASVPTACSYTTPTPTCITVNTPPPTTITANGSTIFCSGGSVQLCAPTPPAGTVYTYAWRNANNPTGQTTQCITATASSTMTVTVTNTTTNCSATTPSATVVNAGAAPAATIAGATSTTICQGQTVRLRTNNASGLAYQWKLGGVDIPGAIDSVYNAGVAGNYTVYVNIAGLPACGNLSPVLAVTVNPLPAAAITASGAPTTVCQGSAVVLTATPAGMNYQWPSPGSGTAQTYSATASGSYTAIVTNPATGCFATSNAVAVTVNPAPPATITAASSTSICAGTSVVLNANTGSGLTYQWFNGATPVATTASYTASVAGSYTVRVTNANGCSATSAATVVTVNPLPPTATAPTGAVSICSGSSVVLNGPTSPTGLTYQWRNGNANASGTSTAASYTATAAGTYRLVVTTAAGCKDSSATTTVTVLPLPTAAMTPNAAVTACDSVVLNTTNTGVAYQWNYNGNPILGATTARYAATVSGNYSLTNTSTTNGCSATTTAVAITINQSPAALITYSSPVNFCAGSAVVLNTYSGSNLTYEWRESNNPIPGATNSTYIATTTGLYTVKVSNTVSGCIGISPALNVRVNPLPVPVINYTAPTNTLSTVDPYAQYQWLLNNQTIGGATQRNYNPRQNGAYSVWVTDTNGCVSQAPIFFVNTLGVSNTAAGKAIKIYPNPTTGLLNVQSPVKVDLTLRDVTGKTVLTGTDKEPLNLEGLADGIYLLYIRDGQGQLIRAEKISKRTY